MSSSPSDTPPLSGGESTIDGRVLVSPELVGARTWFLLFSGDTTRLVPLPLTGELTIGRGETCEVRLDEHRVSRTHARLTMSEGEGRLADLGSQNGTLVNDEPLVGQRVLTSGDVVTIAGVSLVFHSNVRRRRASVLVDPGTFRARLDVELERATRFSRPLSCVALVFSSAPDRARLAPALEGALRPLDLASWAQADQLSVVLPEADEESVRQHVERLLEAIDASHPGVRAGAAFLPDDGADGQTLQSAARAAALAKPPGELGLASQTFQLLQVGAHQALVADGVMVRLYELVRRLASSDLPILVHGETGTGKELVASAVHAFSPRARRRMLSLNCAAVQETLLESELFGHERGAFTGANASKEGIFEAVAGGTIFLDEVGEMSAALQAKLLRALESRRITRVGDTREREVDFRVVAATHRDLAADVKAGRFREDLYFRLAGATVWLPPLRDRKRELALLARRFLEEAFRRQGQPPPLLSPATLHALTRHEWPGNVRELRNAMEYLAATVSEAVIEPWHLADRVSSREPAPARPPPGPAQATPPTPRAFRPLPEEVAELERRRMLEALEAHRWNQTRAAAAIEVPLRTFVTKLKAYGLRQREGPHAESA